MICLGRSGIGHTRVIALAVVDLRMSCRGNNAYLHRLFRARLTGGKSTIRGIGVMAFDSIAYIVRENSHTIHKSNIFFQRAPLGREGRSSSCPTLTIDHYTWIYAPQGVGHGIHGLDVMYGHKIKPESVDMILPGPICHRIDDIFTHHGTVRRRLVAASRGIGVCPVGIVAVEIAGRGERKV